MDIPKKESKETPPREKRNLLAHSKDQPSRDADFYAWLLNQCNALRTRQPDSVDWEGLAEELEEMARRPKHELLSNLEHVFEHLLKLQYESSESERTFRERQWKLHLTEHRNRANDLLGDSRTLRNLLTDLRQKAYERGCKLAKIAIGDRLDEDLPAEPPWTDEEILDDDFFPTTSSGGGSNGHAR